MTATVIKTQSGKYSLSQELSSFTIQDYVKRLDAARKEISTATHYNTVLYHGSGADSSEDGPFRMKFVNMAERQFVADHHADILELAVKLVKDELTSIKDATEKLII